MSALFAQRQTLMHAEAMLLIDDHQDERGKGDALLEQCVSADDDRRRALAEFFERGAARGACLPPGQQRHLDPKRLEPAPKILRMLIGEQFGRRHQGDLSPHLHGLSGRKSGHERFAAADVALHQAQHRRRTLEVLLDFLQHPLLRSRGAKRQCSEQCGLQRAGARQRPTRILLDAPAQQFERELVSQQFLEREPPLGRVAPVEQEVHRRIRRRPVHVLQRFAQARQPQIGEHGRGQPVLDLARVDLLQCHAHQLAQPPLGDALGAGVYRREVFVGDRRLSIDAAIFRMHHLQALRTAANFAEAADACAARQPHLLLNRKIEEPQRQRSRAVADSAQQLAPAAKRNLREQYLALDRRALPRAQFPQRHDASAVLVAQRQEKQQILRGLHAECAKPLGKRIADPAKHRHRLRVDHSATMHSTSICAPRGRAATPTAARAG